jgi:tetratricopeptide (TPR) repeat protein
MKRSFFALLGLVLLVAGPSAAVADDPDPARELDDALGRWDTTAATDALERMPDGVERKVKEGVIAVFRGHYHDAEELLTDAIASGELDDAGAVAEEAHHYLALAGGAQKALGSTIHVMDAEAHVDAVFSDAKDVVLAPYLFAAMAQARAVLATELGVVPDHAVRFEFLDDPAKLAMVTPLTVQNIRTTGTVGVTKHRRVVMITPRVMVHGYGWLDTAVHEYVHYLLTLRTGNNAPVWLQEGLAKLYETRWRRDEPEPLDDGVAYRLHQAIVRDDLVTFAEMYPSVAMLPSAERAALAYAEVETMLGLLRERRGTTAIESLLDRVAAGDDAETALGAAWGGPFSEFYAEWKRVMLVRTAKSDKDEIDVPTFKDGEEAPPAVELGDVFSELGGGKARQHARLGALLHARGHAEAAVVEYERARKSDPRARKDPALARRLGKLYVELERYAEAVPLLEIAAKDAPDDANLAAAQTRALLRTGARAGARVAADRVIPNNPFVPTVHCDLAELAKDAIVIEAERAQCGEIGEQ